MMVADLPVGAISIGDRARCSTKNLLQLQASISVVGLLQPLVVNSRHELVAGMRRLEAVKALGWKTVPCLIVADLDDALAALRAEMAENTCRLAMTPAEIVAFGKRIEALEKEAAKERQRAGGNQHTEPSGKLPEGSRGDTRDKVAAALGVSGKTYEKAKQVVEAAEETPEQFGDLPEVMNDRSVDAAHKELRRRRRGGRRVDWEDVFEKTINTLMGRLARAEFSRDKLAEAMESAAQRLLACAEHVRQRGEETP